MPSPWVTRALRNELPAKELSTGRTYRVEAGEAMAAASISRTKREADAADDLGHYLRTRPEADRGHDPVSGIAYND